MGGGALDIGHRSSIIFPALGLEHSGVSALAIRIAFRQGGEEGVDLLVSSDDGGGLTPRTEVTLETRKQRRGSLLYPPGRINQNTMDSAIC